MKMLITNVKKMVEEIYPKEYFEKKEKLTICDSPFSKMEKLKKPLADFTKSEMQHFINLGKRHVQTIQEQHEEMAEEYMKEIKENINKNELLQKIIDRYLQEFSSGKMIAHHFSELDFFYETCSEEEKLIMNVIVEDIFSKLPNEHFSRILHKACQYNSVLEEVGKWDSIFERGNAISI